MNVAFQPKKTTEYQAGENYFVILQM